MSEERKAGPGRPSTRGPVKPMQIYVDFEDYTFIKSATEDSGETLSEWVREAIKRKIKRTR